MHTFHLPSLYPKCSRGFRDGQSFRLSLSRRGLAAFPFLACLGLLVLVGAFGLCGAQRARPGGSPSRLYLYYSVEGATVDALISSI